MKPTIADRIAKRFGFVRAAGAVRTRSFQGASNTRLTNDWLATSTSADVELRGAVRLLRDRCREAERNDDYVRRYLSLLENNVLGANGIGLQMKVTAEDGSLNREANSAMEMAWWKWGKKRNCTVTRQTTWRGLCRLVLRSAKRDGGALVRFVRGFDNEFNFALQGLEIDHLDVEYDAAMPNGNEVRMGVEFDQWQAPVAYHLFTAHPGDATKAWKPRQRVRVPVADLLHIFLPDRVLQSVGGPAPSATLLRLKMLSGYEEAELVAAREAACKGYGIKRPTPEQYTGQEPATDELQDVEPGMGLNLNPGEEYFGIDPQHPMDAYPVFVKSILRAIAGGLGVSYNSLANDLEGVNYSSLRAGLLEEREEWKAIQQWLIEELCEPVFEEWLNVALAGGAIKGSTGKPFPPDLFEYLNAPEWKPRRWPWVDPFKDMQANILAVDNGFDSRRNIVSECGRDIEDVCMDQKSDDKLAAENGLKFPRSAGAAPASDAENGMEGKAPEGSAVDKEEEDDGQ